MELGPLPKLRVWVYICQEHVITKRFNLYIEFEYHASFLLLNLNFENCESFKRNQTQVRRVDLFWEKEPFHNVFSGQLVTGFWCVF